jgi:uncharacterized protein YutE (UPF0331/DUF86 family)
MITLSYIGVITEKISKKLSKIVSFRNILVHDYTKIDEDIILFI